MTTTIQINTSRIPLNVKYFNNFKSITISSPELFKLGIFKEEISPIHILENDYAYLMSKVPAYVQLYEEFVELTPFSIVNKSSDDRKMKDVSEIVGIAVGLKVTIEGLGVRQEEISKIPTPPKKIKYLDYQFIKNGNSFEVETKGTTVKNINKTVLDIKLKKKNNLKNIHFRFGTITVLQKNIFDGKTIVYLCDDPPKEFEINNGKSETPWHYISALSHLLDNKYYNKIAKIFLKNIKPKLKEFKNKKIFFGTYIFNDEFYLGDFFDFRLNGENIKRVYRGSETKVDTVFKKVTKEQGKHKIFIGIHKKIIDKILLWETLEQILSMKFEQIFQQPSPEINIFRDSDGIIIVNSNNGNDSQIESQFTEDEVKKRMGCFYNWQNHILEACGAPCRSREKIGSSCKIMTTRGNCHFHR
ncbi:MAG: hypothetical protein LCH54_17365 [Bacteroidetes bacterium]|nr:hypothetical protein [Bacteroidota bacterium]